jgi:5'(3')-deoxyribonucleotidase
LKFKWGEVDFDLSTNGAIQKIIDYQNNAQDREIKEELIKSVDSLKVLPPEDALKVLKQFSTNKDNPK